MKKLVRIVGAVVLIYALGFLAFALFPPRPAGKQATDAIVVLTGGEGRIDRALDMLRQGTSRRLFVAGVDKRVRPGAFAAEYGVSGGTMACCVTLDFKSTDTLGNASEAGFWIGTHRFTSVRLVTSDWHMRRAALELRRIGPPGLLIIEDGVPSRPSFELAALEYNKYLARLIVPGWYVK